MSRKATRVEVVTWDWREQPDMNAIALAVYGMSGGAVFMSPVDTGSDQYAWVISDAPLSPLQVKKLMQKIETPS